MSNREIDANQSLVLLLIDNLNYREIRKYYNKFEYFFQKGAQCYCKIKQGVKQEAIVEP
jgi:hypothetical protein